MISQAEIRERVQYLNRRLEECNQTHRLAVEWSYGRPKICLTTVDKPGIMKRELSPRLPTGDMMRWLDAWECGFFFRDWDMAGQTR